MARALALLADTKSDMLKEPKPRNQVILLAASRPAKVSEDKQRALGEATGSLVEGWPTARRRTRGAGSHR